MILKSSCRTCVCVNAHVKNFFYPFLIFHKFTTYVDYHFNVFTTILLIANNDINLLYSGLS